MSHSPHAIQISGITRSLSCSVFRVHRTREGNWTLKVFFIYKKYVITDELLCIADNMKLLRIMGTS